VITTKDVFGKREVKMKRNLWKTVIVICALAITIVLLSLIANKLFGLNTEPTQIMESNQTQEESITVVSATITEKVTQTEPEVQLSPSITRSITLTQKPSLETTVFKSSTPTITPSQTATIGITYPTEIPASPTQQPTEVIDTPIPLPTATQMTTVTCGVNPSTIPGETLSTQQYWGQFSPPQAGLGIADISFSIIGSGQRSCSAASDNSGYASCEGSAGMLPFGQKITVTIRTSVGNCITYLYTSNN